MAAYSSSSVASPTPSTAPSVVWPSRRAVSSLDSGGQQAGHDERRGEVALAARVGVQEPLEPEAPEAAQDRHHRAVGQARVALEPVGGEEPLAPQAAPDEIDQLGRQVAQVAHRLGLDLAVLAVRPAQQVGLVHPALVVPTRRRDMDGAASRAHTRIIAEPDPHVKYISAYARRHETPSVRAQAWTCSCSRPGPRRLELRARGSYHLDPQRTCTSKLLPMPGVIG